MFFLLFVFNCNARTELQYKSKVILKVTERKTTQYGALKQKNKKKNISHHKKVPSSQQALRCSAASTAEQPMNEHNK